MTEPVVFIVSEDAQFCQSVRTLVETAGLRAITFPGLQALLAAEEPVSHGCLVFYPQHDTLGDPQQRALLAAACAGRPGILVIERGNVPVAVHALKAGITDVVQKPYRDKDLLERIVNALEVPVPV
jgi:two-component system CheB/CheR fusion protein